MAGAGKRRPPLPVQVADVGGGSLHLIIGLLTAVIRRLTTGVGSFVDISMFDGALAWNSLGAAHALIGGHDPESERMMLNGGAFYDLYETEDGRLLAVGSLEPKFWAGFCAAIGREDLIESGLNFDIPHQQTLKDEIQATIAAKTWAQWRDIFAERDLCVEPVLTTSEALAHPQTEARRMVVDVPHLDGSTQKQVGCPIKMSDFNPAYTHIGASLGAHTRRILAELGYSDEAIDDLITAEIVAG